MQRATMPASGIICDSEAYRVDNVRVDTPSIGSEDGGDNLPVENPEKIHADQETSSVLVQSTILAFPAETEKNSGVGEVVEEIKSQEVTSKAQSIIFKTIKCDLPGISLSGARGPLPAFKVKMTKDHVSKAAFDSLKEAV